MGDPGDISTIQDVLATEPVIRRVVAARVANPADVDDLVHDCLERLLAARHRLAPGTVLPFGVVTAQNLVVSQARTAARRAAPGRRTLAPPEPDRPEDQILAGEARTAMQTALSQLTGRERADLLAYQELGTRAARTTTGESSGAMRVRMARTRAKLRLEYLLAFRRVALPTPACRSVLLAISSGDTRRQGSLGAGGHLVDCPTCASLHEPLATRNLALTGVAFPVATAGWLGAKVRAHPLPSAAATGAAAAGAVVAVALVHPAAAARRQTPAPVSGLTTAPATKSGPPVATTIARPAPWLTVKGSPLAASALHGAVGQTAASTAARVEQVVTHNGFWIGTDGNDRVWVELVGPLRPLHLVTGERLRFKGTVRANPPSYAARVGLTAAGGAAQLTEQRAHIDLPTTAVQIIAPG
jgi:RNA polymerase sigma factor (sigma-70 family)